MVGMPGSDGTVASVAGDDVLSTYLVCGVEEAGEKAMIFNIKAPGN